MKIKCKIAKHNRINKALKNRVKNCHDGERVKLFYIYDRVYVVSMLSFRISIACMFPMIGFEICVGLPMLRYHRFKSQSQTCCI